MYSWKKEQKITDWNKKVKDHLHWNIEQLAFLELEKKLFKLEANRPTFHIYKEQNVLIMEQNFSDWQICIEIRNKILLKRN